MRNTIRTSVMLMTILQLPLLVLVAQETSALLIEGQQGQARVIQVQGKNYVEVQGQRESQEDRCASPESNHFDFARRSQCSTSGRAVRTRGRPLQAISQRGDRDDEGNP